MGFLVSVDHGEKIRESEKGDKYFDITKLKKKQQWNVHVTLVPIEVGGFEKGP